jgi:type 9 secretion system plug protein
MVRWGWLCALALWCGCKHRAPVVDPPAPVDDYYDPTPARVEPVNPPVPQRAFQYDDRSYIDDIRTVQVWRNGVEGDVPVITLGTIDRLLFHFDDLSSAGDPLSYTVIHCTAAWEPSDLVPVEYLDGAPSDFVPSPRYSSGTRQSYLHYAIPFPNSMMRPRISGNYLLLVYRGSDRDDPVLTRRFMVTEQRVTIDARVVASRDVEQRDAQQQVDLVIRHEGFPIPDPFGDLQVTVLQNQRWDDARTGALPRFTRVNELVYDHPKEFLFNGANEWRPLEATSVRSINTEVRSIVDDSSLYRFVLVPDPKRNISMYVAQSDLNGRHLVRTDDGYDPTIEADYVVVDWTLPWAAELPGGRLFVYGAFGNYSLLPEFQCTWEGGAYRARALVKQGFVDYCYAFVRDGSAVPDLTVIEGSHYATENDYLVLVYLKDWSLRADRLIATRAIVARR